MYKLHTASSSESGIGEGDGEGSAVEDFFNNFVPRLSSLAQEDDEILDDPTIDLDAMAVCQPPPQKKMLRQQKQQQHHHHQSHRPKMIMANSNNSNNSNRDSNSSDSGRDLSMDEIGLIVGQLRSGGPYKDKLVAIMLKGLEKTLTSGVYRLFLEAGLPDNWCPIVKMNNDNTPFVEFLIKSDLSDQDPFSQLNEYSTEHMALCKFVVEQLHQNATRHTHPQLAAPSKRSLTPHHHQLQQKPKQQQQQLLVQQQKAQKQPQQQPQQKTQQKPQQQQQAPQQQAPQQQAPQKQAPSQQPQQQPPQQQPTQQQQQPQLPKPKPLSLLQQTRSFGTPLACSTPKSEKQRILPPRACKSAKNHQKH